MRTTLRVLLCSLMLAATTSWVWADTPPGRPGRDPISLDWNSPSVTMFGNTPGEIYGENPPWMFWGTGWDVGGPGPILHVIEPSYGLFQPGPADNNDAHSNNEADPTVQQFIFFSGDLNSAGAPLTAYNNQFVRNQACGDRFVTNGPTTGSPQGTIMFGMPSTIAGPVFPGPINLISANQTRFNEIPSIPPPVFNWNWQPDNMDALELTVIDFNGDNIHDTDLYFSLDPASMSVTNGMATQSDILWSPPGSGMFMIYAPEGMLGLQPGDDVDALAVWDFGGIGAVDPGIDYAIFSLAPGSPSLDPDGIPGSGDELSAADIFVTDFNGFHLLFLAYNSIGMLFSDNVDALDVEIQIEDPRPQVFDWWVQRINIDIWVPPSFPPPWPPNDFHILINGIEPEQVGDLWIPPEMPDVEVIDTSGGVEIAWRGGEPAPGSWMHVGLTVIDDTNPDMTRMWWTWDDDPIGDVPSLWQDWDWVFDEFTGEVFIVDIIRNDNPEPVWVQRRVNTTATPVELDDLMVDGELFATGVEIDPEPVMIDSFFDITYDFSFNNETRGYVMMYEVWEDDGGMPGEPIATYLNAVTPIEFSGLLGDLNCDGLVNGFDIDAFILAIGGDPDAYFEAYPNCDIWLADCNQDGALNGFDIDPFIQLVGGG